MEAWGANAKKPHSFCKMCGLSAWVPQASKKMGRTYGMILGTRIRHVMALESVPRGSFGRLMKRFFKPGPLVTVPGQTLAENRPNTETKI